MLTITNLSKKYKNETVVNKFNFHLEQGHIYGIVGPNGAGKTTFFKMLAGLVIPTEGKIEVSQGESIEEFRKTMSFMIEMPYLYEQMTAFQNMKIIAGIKGESNENNLKELLELVNLSQTGKKKVKDFSLGMRQRLGIACALAANPKVIVLDEPMNGVDPEGIVELRELLLKLCRKREITLLVSSHILEEMYHLSTDFIFIKKGNVVNKISKAELKKLTSGIIEIEANDQSKVLEFLRKEYDDKSISIVNDRIQIYKDAEQIPEISKRILDNGYTFTMISAQPVNLEQYYMEQIVGDKNA